MTTKRLDRRLALFPLVCLFACGGPEDDREDAQWRAFDVDKDGEVIYGNPCGGCPSCAQWRVDWPMVEIVVGANHNRIFEHEAVRAIVPIEQNRFGLEFHVKETAPMPGGVAAWVRLEVDRGSLAPAAGTGVQYALESAPEEIVELTQSGLESLPFGDLSARLHAVDDGISAAAPIEPIEPLTLALCPLPITSESDAEG